MKQEFCLNIIWKKRIQGPKPELRLKIICKKIIHSCFIAVNEARILSFKIILAGFEILKAEKILLKRKCIVKRVLKKSLWTRGQSGYPQVTCRGRVEALGVRIESGRQKVLPVRRLLITFTL